MKIKHVEELVGITRKNIRFYEEQGLLSPNRAENGYREYHEPEIIRLKQIKLLRKLSLPIEEIRKAMAGEQSLEIILTRHLRELQRQRQSLDEMEGFSRHLIEEHASLDTLDVDACLEQMRGLEKEGARFMDVKKTDVHKKKKLGALIGGGSMILLMGLMIVAMLWGNIVDPIPLGLLIMLIALPVIIIVAVVAVFIERVREIEGGEEDVASKY